MSRSAGCSIMASMFLYFGKRFDSTQVGRRVVKVECNRCGCEYFYELTRIGIGAASAPYGIGTGSASRRAQKLSETDLQKRLTREADLVPCPRCNWINDELVQGYRRGRYRGLNKLALLVGIIGTACGLICAWFVSIGPPADRGAVPYVLFGGPAVFVLLTIAVILLRNALRWLIRPNRHFPRAPKLPPNTPPALMLDSATGQLRLAGLCTIDPTQEKTIGEVDRTGITVRRNT